MCTCKRCLAFNESGVIKGRLKQHVLMRQRNVHSKIKCCICKEEIKLGDKYTAIRTGFEKCLECSDIIKP